MLGLPLPGSVMLTDAVISGLTGIPRLFLSCCCFHLVTFHFMPEIVPDSIPSCAGVQSAEAMSAFNHKVYFYF